MTDHFMGANQSSQTHLGIIDLRCSSEDVAIAQLGAAAILMWEEMPFELRHKLVAAVGGVDSVPSTPDAKTQLLRL